MVNVPTQIPDCDSHSPALLDLFLSSEAIICSTMAFLPMGNFDHVVVSWDAPFHCITYDRLPIVLSTNTNLLYLLYSRAQRCCLLHLINQNCLLINFSENSNFDDSVISLRVFPSKTSLKLHNIS